MNRKRSADVLGEALGDRTSAAKKQKKKTRRQETTKSRTKEKKQPSLSAEDLELVPFNQQVHRYRVKQVRLFAAEHGLKKWEVIELALERLLGK